MEASVFASKVFVSGGVPESTYVSRDSEGLAEKLKAARHNYNVTVVSGMTKSGKSVLAKKIFPESESVWIRGGSADIDKHFWLRLLEGLNENINFTRQETSTEEKTKSAQGNIGIPGAGIGGGGGSSQSRQVTETVSAHGDLVGRVCKLLFATKTPVVIDDFHLLHEDVRKAVSRTAKGLVFEGVPIILLTIKHRREDVITALPELMGRVSLISVPPWSEAELVEIAYKGFKVLNVNVAQNVISAFAKASRESPWLMQKLCLRLCEDEGIIQKNTESREITYNDSELDSFFHAFAESEPQGIYVSFVKQPTNNPRKKRNFKNGGEGDIYEAITRALSRLLRENGGSFSFQALRETLKKILAEMPQSGEISQALNQMSKIKMSGEDSDALLTFDAQLKEIHINDPYLAFYLIWGDALANGGQNG